MRKSSSQWSFANNSTAAYSQFLSFKSAQEQGGTHKSYPPGFSQRSLGGSQHLVQGHPWQSKDVHITSQTNQLGPSAISSSVLSSHLTPNIPSVATTVIGALPISTVPPSNGPVVGSTDLKNAPSISIGPCQLTIFYNGSVCVYDNVSPEKAQAIMLLAGNGDSKSSNFSASAALPSLPKVQPAMPRPPVRDNAILNHSAGSLSPVSLPTVSKPVSSHLAIPSSCAVEINSIKPVVALTPTRVNCTESPKPVAPVEASGTKSVSSNISSGAPIEASGAKSIPSAVPQARKASLARFLEKRKDRVTAVAPYVINKSDSECSTIGAGGSSFLMNAASSNPLPASN